MRTVVIISPFFLKMKRGIEVFTYSLSNELSKNDGLNIIIYTWSNKNPIKWTGLNNKIKIRKVPYTGYYREYLAIICYKLWLFYDRPYKKILNFLWHGESSIINKYKDIVIFHNPYKQIPSRYEYSKKYIDDNTHVILDSKDSLYQFREFYKNDNIGSVIHTGVDIDFFSSINNNKEKFDLKNIKLVCISEFEKRKGIQYLLYSMPLLLEEFNVNVKIIGSGECDSYYKEIINELKLYDKVEIHPPVINTKKDLLESDVYFLLSHGEGFPLGLLEAMSCGIPSITSSLPPFDEFDSGTIIKVDRNEPIQIKNALKILSDKEAYNRFSLNSRKYVLDNHSWEIIGKQYIDIINN